MRLNSVTEESAAPYNQREVNMLQRYLYSFFAVAVLAGGAWAQTTTTTTTITQTLNLPPIGLASSETAQINVTNLAANSSNGTAASCTGSISFVNGSGATIGTATSFTVAAGKTDSVTLPYSATSASGRTEIRGVITLTITSGMPAPCNLVSSLETYDTSSGVTHAFVAGPSGAAAVHPTPVAVFNPGR
jgi:hypothetical protein